jgi:hypothetical protein
MKRKRIFIILTIIALLFCTTFYIHSKYFFNPITFKEDNITYLPFTWYQKPMIYSYRSLVNNKIKGENIERDKDISFIYRELKKSKIIGPIQLNNGAEPIKPLIGNLTIKSSKSGGCNVTTLMWYGKESNICEVSGGFLINNQRTNTNLVIEITSDLKNFLVAKFDE